jgi:hypothetical protein
VAAMHPGLMRDIVRLVGRLSTECDVSELV